MVDPINNISPVTPGSTGGSLITSVTPAGAIGGDGMSGSATLIPAPPAFSAGRSTFFADHLTAFEIWLDFESSGGDSPALLPIVLQVLLSQTHRLRALLLLKRYLALGPHAVQLALLVGIYPYILKLLTNPSSDIKDVLVCIWASIIGFDVNLRSDLTKDKTLLFFINYLAVTKPTSATLTLTPTLSSATNNASVPYRCLAAFVLAEVCNGNQEARATCLQQGLQRSCSQALTCEDALSSPDLKKWICLCLFKLCEDFAWAKYLCITETGHPQLYPLLGDADTSVRAASVLALGELFGSSLMNPPITQQMSAQSPPRSANSSMNNLLNPGNQTFSRPLTHGHLFSDQNANLNEQVKRLLETELLLAIQLLDSCTDGCVMVRKEAVTALSKFALLPVHVDCIKMVVSELRNFVRLFVDNPGYISSQPIRAGAAIPISINHSNAVPQTAGSFGSPSNINFGIPADELNPGGAANENQLMLTQMQVESIIMKLDEYLDRIGFNLRESGQSMHGSTSPTFSNNPYPSSIGRGDTEGDGRTSLEMARNYLRLWLALQEVTC